MEDWHHIAQTPGGFHIHRIDPINVLQRASALRAEDPELSESDAVAEIHGEIAEAIRTALSFPIRGRWLQREGWHSSLSVGAPHPHLMAVVLGPRAGTSATIAIDGIPLATEYEPSR